MIPSWNQAGPACSTRWLESLPGNWKNAEAVRFLNVRIFCLVLLSPEVFLQIVIIFYLRHPNSWWSWRRRNSRHVLFFCNMNLWGPLTCLMLTCRDPSVLSLTFSWATFFVSWLMSYIVFTMFIVELSLIEPQSHLTTCSQLTLITGKKKRMKFDNVPCVCFFLWMYVNSTMGLWTVKATKCGCLNCSFFLSIYM